MALTENDIVNRIQAQFGIFSKDSIGITEILLELIKSSLESGEDVLLSGFGKFCVKKSTQGPKPGHRRGCHPAGQTRSDVQVLP